ncbi:MAG: hypothetical protein IKB34_06675 [Clostridia bacterium]|nr:hypothetical protein [Clostridia bacterium]
MDDKNFKLSLADIDRLGTSIIKKAFRSFRQLLIVLLYVIAIFFVLNDFSLSVTSAEDMAVNKLPWLLLYVLTHYFCRDYGIQKGREDEEYQRVEGEYRKLCEQARAHRHDTEEYCAELSRHYEQMRRSELFSTLSVAVNEHGEPITKDLGKRARRALRRGLRRKPIHVSYRLLVDHSHGKSADFRPIKPSFESYIRRNSVITVLKIVFLSFFTFSLTASIGEDPLGNLIAGTPYLVTMLSISMTSALSAYRSVISYDVDCLNDRIAILSHIFDRHR